MFTKPIYKIPSMAEINSAPWNGLKVASLFAGGGGSSTGYKWAGYKVVWANEFERNPQLTYRSNYPQAILNPRDIATVTPEEILFVTGLKRGELDVLEGSPPCQGFSIASQNRLQNKVKVYENGISQTNEDMFSHYVRILNGLQPKVFVAENVKGLTMGKAKSILGSFEMDLFDDQSNTIVHSLMDCGYVVRWQILNAADYGTPQSRQRVFFIGVRKDIGIVPTFPAKQGYQYSVLDALPHLSDSEVCWSDLNGQGTSPNLNKDRPAPCVTRRGHKDSGGKTAIRHSSHGKIVWNDGNQPSPSILASDATRKESSCMAAGFLKITNGNVGGHSSRRGEEISVDKPITTIMVGSGGRCGRGQTQFQFGYGSKTTVKPKKEEIKLIAPSRNERTKKECSFSMPDVDFNKPVSTITKGSPGNDLPVPMGETKRKFTIAELKRLGGFPDDYILTGSYSKQWEVIGNSVCPPQMKALATHIHESIFNKL